MAEIQRGAIISPISYDGESFFTLGDIPFLDILPAALLYWDRLLTPIAIRGMAPQYDAAVDALVSLGAAETFDLKDTNSFSAGEIQFLVHEASKQFHQYRNRAGETWCLLPALADQKLITLAELYQDETNMKKQLVIEIALKDALPVPERDVPYQEILEFRNSRQDELKRLHIEIENIASTYASHPEEEEPITKALERMELTLKDIEKVYSEKWTSKLRRSLTSVSLTQAVLPMVILKTAGLPIDKAFLVGLLNATIGAVVDEFGFKSPPDRPADPFIYALGAKNL